MKFNNYLYHPSLGGLTFNIFFDSNTWNTWKILSVLSFPGSSLQGHSQWNGEGVTEWVGGSSQRRWDQDGPYRGCWGLKKAWSSGQKWVNARLRIWKHPEASSAAPFLPGAGSQLVSPSTPSLYSQLLAATGPHAFFIHLTAFVWRKWKWLLGQVLLIPLRNQGPSVQGWHKMFGQTSRRHNIWILLRTRLCQGCF